LSFKPAALATGEREALLESTLQVSAEGAYALPGWGGVLRATPARRSGIGLAALRRIQLLPRSGAEQFQIGPGRPPRSLKKQYQSAGVPANRRGGPLLYSEGRLLFVPGLGIDARAMAAPGDAQMTLEWLEQATSECAVSMLGRDQPRR